MREKDRLREQLRRERRAHVESLPAQTRALIFRRPPAAVAQRIPAGATVGIYAESAFEAPASGYGRWLAEEGHVVALPWFAARGANMEFRLWANPHDDDELVTGPDGIRQPPANAPLASPSVVFVPLVGFTAEGYRLGQGAGHYDRWLAAHPGTLAIGLAWDCQLREALPFESHDVALDTVVTPTRLYQGDRS
ncbi:5-formyltetrahydrofolate cyclo-ligase [Novosphingobium tardum]|uniref:5-formyltetrahydrofolate cyclo-ligase n=1 Tax=Novosphingobium tardum TaxID=1538021 RepID=A0ABV8RQA5_9SPHN